MVVDLIEVVAGKMLIDTEKQREASLLLTEDNLSFVIIELKIYI